MALSRKGNSKSSRNFTAVLAAFIPFALLIVSGVIMLVYHISESQTLVVWGFEKQDWLLAHKIAAISALPFVLWHLLLHADWFYRLFTLKLKNKYKGLNITLFIVFSLSIITSILSWLVFQGSAIAAGLKGVHSKLGFLLIIFFIFHLKSYLPWVIRMAKRTFYKA